MKTVLLKIILNVLCLFPLKKIILFESFPSFSGNTEMVFDELLNRKINETYKFVWVVDDNIEIPEKYKRVKNFKTVQRNSYLYKFYYSCFGTIFITENYFLDKRRKSQYYIYLAHGNAMKLVKGKYSIPDNCKDCDVVTISDYMAKYDSANLSCSVNNMRVLGFARNDKLFSKDKLDLNKIFKNNNAEKFIYWLPTYRQHKNIQINAIHSNISMPILYDENICAEINNYAKSKNILIIIKPHPAQDIRFLTKVELSNLIFIGDEFLHSHNIDNYDVLNSVDALLTDYSSVYYDFLLKNKPIGLCWDDFDEYNKREGFIIDPNFIMSGGEKIYNKEDLKGFIERVSMAEDVLLEQRNNICELVHKYKDGKSASRIADYIIKKAVKL